MRDEIIVAIAELRTAARSGHDERRADATDWLDDLFAGVTDEHSLHETAAEGFDVYGGGMGSSQDVGSTASAQVVGELYVAPQCGRTLGAEPVASEPLVAAHRRTPAADKDAFG